MEEIKQEETVVNEKVTNTESTAPKNTENTEAKEQTKEQPETEAETKEQAEQSKKPNPNAKKRKPKPKLPLKGHGWINDLKKAHAINEKIQKDRLNPHYKLNLNTNAKIRITPLGGLGEIGGNMMVMETEKMCHYR